MCCDASDEPTAVALMRRLIALDLGAYPELIGPRINFAGFLEQTGHAEEALDYAAGMESQLSRGANEFGRMLVASTVVCALSNLGRASEAPPWIERMRAQESENWKALHQAYLCLNDLDSAEALLIRQLGGPEPEGAILMLRSIGRTFPTPPRRRSASASTRSARARRSWRPWRGSAASCVCPIPGARRPPPDAQGLGPRSSRHRSRGSRR